MWLAGLLLVVPAIALLLMLSSAKTKQPFGKSFLGAAPFTASSNLEKTLEHRMLAEPDSKTSADRWRNTNYCLTHEQRRSRERLVAGIGRALVSARAASREQAQLASATAPPIGRFGLNVGAGQ